MALNVEKTVVDWLNTDPRLKRWPAMFDVPASSTATHPTRFVTVERTGGPEERFRSLPLLAVQVWGETRWIAAEAATRLVLPRLKAMPGGVDPVADVDVTGMSHLPMPDGRPRYQLLVQLTCKSS